MAQDMIYAPSGNFQITHSEEWSEEASVVRVPYEMTVSGVRWCWQNLPRVSWRTSGDRKETVFHFRQPHDAVVFASKFWDAKDEAEKS